MRTRSGPVQLSAPARSESALRAGTRPARAQGILFVVLSALAFGAMAILARLAFDSGVDVATLLALRFAIAGACLTVLVAIRRTPLPRGRMLGAAMLLGGVVYAGQAATFFVALKFVPAGIAALLLYLHPALVAVLAWMFLRERMGATKVAALVIALAGMTLTIGPALHEPANGLWPSLSTGIGLSLAAAAIYAGYIVTSSRLTASVPPLALSAVVVSSAAVVFVLASMLAEPRLPATTAGWAAIIAMALVSTVAAITLFFAGLARIGPTQASTISTVEPVFTVLLAAVALGEAIALSQLAGGALILAAVALLAHAPDGAPAVAVRATDARD